MNRRSLTLALSLSPGIGAKTIIRIHTRNDLLGRTPDEFLRIGPEALVEEYKVRRIAAEQWSSGQRSTVAKAAKLEERFSTSGVQWVTAAEAHYPRIIEQLDPDPPGVLFVYGNIRLFEAKTACVLASRGASDASLKLVEAWSEERVLKGQVLVSGHDTPAYQRAAVVPLRWGAPRVLVLDRGLYNTLGDDLSAEPFAAARLWRFHFDPKTDLVVSAVRPESDYHRNSNRVRDRLVASLSHDLDFVEVRPNGMMESLARSALRAGRPVRVCELAEAAESLAQLGASRVAYSPIA